MEFSNQQKMHQGQVQTLSICSQLNLNPQKLNIQSLMSSVTYRRLYNIVKNDMSRSDLSFRKNLIKQLYFLLQITPIIKPQLTQHFLNQVQKWYNLNDHKKIDLASSKLNDLLSIVHHSKKDSGRDNQRPKTGGAWNTNVSPFLRPYTASRPRPDSSKMGGQSTREDTNDFCIRQFTTNIQEQLQMSQDFLQRHRTNHPDYEPTYEQLYHILKKVERQTQNQPPIPQQHPALMPKCGRYSKSALPRRRQQPAMMIVRQNPQSEQHIAQAEQAEVVENQERERDSDSSSSEEEEMLYVSDKRQQPTHNLRLQVPSPTAEPKPDGLQKYLHCTEQKLVQALREDREMAENYVGFARAKTAFKKQLNRKNESRRLLSAKQGAREYRVKQTYSSNDKDKQNIRGRFFDLTQDPLSQPADAPDPYPTYNRRQFLNARYAQPLRRFKKLNNTEQVVQKVKGKVKRPMTACVRFQSPIRFDPLSTDNVATYNAEVLEQIQKIKLRMGGKCAASTDSLMKALYVDNSPSNAKWEDLNPFFGMISKGKDKKLKKKGRRPKSKAKISTTIK